MIEKDMKKNMCVCDRHVNVMEKLYIVSKTRPGADLAELSWVAQIINSYCQIQTYIEESRENH